MPWFLSELPGKDIVILCIDVSDKVFIFGSAANPMKLPEVGAWVLVKITAIYNPSHFWVQLPSGVENLTSQLIKRVLS